MQPHLRKCFDAIAKLEFGVKFPESEMEIAEDGTLVEKEMSFQTRDMLQAKLAKTASPEDLTTDIVAMLSPEGERVNLGKVLHINYKMSSNKRAIKIIKISQAVATYRSYSIFP